MDDIVALCKRRGFVFPASELYGGLNGFWDYGPLGVALKNNLRDAWWHDMVVCPPNGPDGAPLIEAMTEAPETQVRGRAAPVTIWTYRAQGRAIAGPVPTA